jgi:hypothetical protein
MTGEGILPEITLITDTTRYHDTIFIEGRLLQLMLLYFLEVSFWRTSLLLSLETTLLFSHRVDAPTLPAGGFPSCHKTSSNTTWCQTPQSVRTPFISRYGLRISGSSLEFRVVLYSRTTLARDGPRRYSTVMSNAKEHGLREC